jgi:hypothetical protein
MVDLNKNDLHLLRFLPFYRGVSIFFTAFGLFAIPYSVYVRLTSGSCMFLNNALIAASITVAAMGYMTFCFLRLIGTYKREYDKLPAD